VAWARQSAGGKWGGVYRDAAGDVKYLPCEHRTKTEAKRAAAIEEDKARNGARNDPAGRRMKWGDWCDQWQPTRGVEPSTAASGTSYVKRCRAKWGDVALGMISQHDVQEWVRELGRTLSASSVRQAFYLLSASMNAAISKWPAIGINPCKGVVLPALPVADERYLTDLEVNLLRYHLDERWRLLVDLLLGTGLRLAEACGLHWQRVDLDAKSLVVVETYEVTERAIKGYPKSRRIRRVPLSDELVELLVDWRTHHPDTGSCGRRHMQDDSKRAQARERAAKRGRDTIEPPGSCYSSLVIAGPRGAPIDPRNFAKREWARAVELSGIPHATPHSTRHTYASRLLTEDVPIARVSRLLGHAQQSTTERYAWLIDEELDDVRAILNGEAAKPAVDVAAAAEELRTIVDAMEASPLRNRLERLADDLSVDDAARDASTDSTRLRGAPSRSSWRRPRAV
jgi:integrase